MNYIIYQTAFIGDIILSTSLIKTIKDVDPSSKIIFITTPVGQSIIHNNMLIDNILVYDKKGKDRGVAGFFSIVNDVKGIIGKDESVYLSLHRFVRASVAGYLIRSKIRAGFKDSALSFLYNRKIPYEFGIHDIERNFNILKAAISDELNNQDPEKPELFPSEEDFLRVRNIIQDKFATDSRIVSIAPGSVWQTKRWPIEHFLKLIELLSSNGINSILIGGKEDREICDTLTSEGVLNLAGDLTLIESAAAISLSRGIVTNDSAPLHMASAMNIPTIAIFGSTTPFLGFGPLADNSLVLENSELECRPCGRHGGNKCKKKHFECMRKIFPEMVFDELLKVI